MLLKNLGNLFNFFFILILKYFEGSNLVYILEKVKVE